MGKYSGGIGLTEGIAMMGAIEAMHGCRAKLTVTTRGQAHNGCAHIELEAVFPVLPGSELPRVVKVEHDWPTRAVRTFEGLLYNLAWQLDYAIQQAYEQMKLAEK